jgi:hypothetical protein
MVVSTTFYRLDRNDDNRLTRAELGSVRPSNSFSSLDANGDSRISLGEWPGRIARSMNRMRTATG